MGKELETLEREIRILHEEYHKTVEGRKEIINSIRQKIKAIRKITGVYNAELDELERYYSYRDYYISDYNLVMSLLLRLANSEEDLYTLRKAITTDFYSLGNETKQLYSDILFITDNYAQEKIDDHIYYYDEFAKLSTDLINQGHSMIIITKNLFENKVKPRKNNIKCDSVFDIRNGGLNGDITCYVNSPSLKESIDKFIKYVNVNGPDFSNIDENTLFELMNKSNSYQKTIK